MKQYVHCMKEILLLRESPQALPASMSLMLPIVIAAVLVNLLSGSLIYPVTVNIMRALFETVILLLFIQFALQLAGHKLRFNQTVTALFSVQLILSLLALPIIIGFSSQAVQESRIMYAMLGLMLLLLLMYSVVMMSHILKYALSLVLQKAMFISIAYHIISITLIGFMFPSSSM